jgi:hypothetical protein
VLLAARPAGLRRGHYLRGVRAGSLRAVPGPPGAGLRIQSGSAGHGHRGALGFQVSADRPYAARGVTLLRYRPIRDGQELGWLSEQLAQPGREERGTW